MGNGMGIFSSSFRGSEPNSADSTTFLSYFTGPILSQSVPFCEHKNTASPQWERRYLLILLYYTLGSTGETTAWIRAGELGYWRKNALIIRSLTMQLSS